MTAYYCVLYGTVKMGCPCQNEFTLKGSFFSDSYKKYLDIEIDIEKSIINNYKP